jgi:hypothetical protein
MHRRVIRTVLAVLSLSSFALKAADQKVKPSALADCKAEVERLKTENADLQKKLNEVLTKQLEAMKEAAKKPTEAEANALAALRALASVVDTAGYADFKKYLLDAKVKAESLPPGPAKDSLIEVLGLFLDIGSAWQHKLGQYGSVMSGRDVDSYGTNFPDLKKNVQLQGSSAGSYYRSDDVLVYMTIEAKRKVDAFSLPGR